MNRKLSTSLPVAVTVAGAAVLLTGLAFSQSARPAPGRPSAPAAAESAAPVQVRPIAGVLRFDARPSGISHLNFVSDAPLETVEGLSTATTGSVTVDLANPSRNLTGSVQIPTSSLRTGNEMRDGHLAGAQWFDAARYPNIVFELRSTDITTAISPNTPVRGNLTGRLTLHGVTREVTLPVTVRTVPFTPDMSDMVAFGINADMLRVQGEFNVRLSDYGVSIFAPLRLKVSNEIRIRVDLTTFRAG